MKPLVGKRLPTGIVALDHALGGGLRLPSRVAIIGTPGSGKSGLLRRIADVRNTGILVGPCEDETLDDALDCAGPIALLDGEFAVQPLRWMGREKLRDNRLTVACVRTNAVTESKVLKVVHDFDVVLWIRYLTHRNLHVPEYTVVKVLKNRFGPVSREFAV